MVLTRWSAGLVVVAACGGGGPDDAMVPVDIDNGTCGTSVRFTGEYVDWDSGANFCGVRSATFQVPGGGATDTTAPNGRFDLCVPDQAVTLVDILPSPEMSQCTNPLNKTYSLPGIAVASKAVIFAGGFWSGRALPDGRETLDPTRAHVVVHVNGTPRPVSLAADHGPTQAMPAEIWQAGDTGHEVFFPDVVVGTGETTLSVAGGAIGTGPIPLVAGKMTTVSVVTN